MCRPAPLLTIAILAVATTLAAPVAHAAPVPQTVTFTGRLYDGTTPLSGAHDFDFALYDAPAGGTMVWGESHAALSVTNGLVDVALGDTTALGSTFTGESLYLEVTLDGATLDGRVAIASVPYALRAAVAVVAETLAPGVLAQLDSAYLKRGATLACAGTNKVTGIDPATGNVICGADGGGTTYTEGYGIDIVGTAITVDINQVQARTVGTCGGDAISGISASGILTCSTLPTPLNGGGLAIDANAQLSIAPNSISSGLIADGQVTSADIGNGTVASIDIADGAITSVDVADGTITTIDLADGSVTSAKLANDSVGSAQIALSAVGSSEIADFAVGTAKLTDNAVNSAKIADNAVGASEVLDDSLGPDDISLPMAAAAAGALVTLTATGTSNRSFPVLDYTPTSNQKCMITITANLTNAGASATGSASLRLVVNTNADVSTAATQAGAYTPAGNTSITKAAITQLTAGVQYDFGCQVNASGDYVGDSMDCSVVYFCQ